jgi:hypothetical protein
MDENSSILYFQLPEDQTLLIKTFTPQLSKLQMFLKSMNGAVHGCKKSSFPTLLA